jgi:lycopene beta-cyclase
LVVDLVLVGGGLANSLIAYRLSLLKPELQVLLVERDPHLGGEHTWSFNTADLTKRQHDWIAPFVEYSWPGYEVRFPAFRHWFDSGYHTITTDRLHDVVAEALRDRVLLGSEVDSIEPGEVTTTDGRLIQAESIIDGRGPVDSPNLVVRFQKFVGQVVRLERPHGLKGPILMDATVEQIDGYRFIYVLPFTEKTVLIEDTRYSDTPSLEREEYVFEIGRYADAQGWGLEAVLREEEGVLPLPLSGDIESLWNEEPRGVARSGLRAALFHPTTSYSLPNAVELADDLCEKMPLVGNALFEHVKRRSERHWRDTSYFRMLNRMLFLAAEPSRRRRVFERFYKLNKPLIERFYAGSLTPADRLRLVFGRPPVPIGNAVVAVFSDGRRDADIERWSDSKEDR